MNRADRFKEVIAYFEQHRPMAETELVYRDVYELLVAVILSAQCTDKRVNLITTSFFHRFPDVYTLSRATIEEIFVLIQTCSYPNNKAKHLSGMAKMVIDDFQGHIPGDIDVLQKLPGVGRKTANVIASVAFGIPALAVDTHVFRVSARIGLTWRAKNPLEAEKQLLKFIPREILHIAHHWLILHGRYVCLARKPRCAECGLQAYCKYFQSRASKTTP